jgi:hypothetical protein
MEATKASPLVAVDVIPPNPSTKRGEITHMNVSNNGQYLMYTVKKSLVLSRHDDLGRSFVYSDFTQEVTACAMSPSGYYVAVGDALGGVTILGVKGMD